MADTVAALDECLTSTRGKVDRIRQAIDAADADHAYDDFNGFLNRIYLVDPTKRETFEPKFIDFEELYQFVRISLSEMIQQHEDEQKSVADLVAAKQLESAKANSISRLGGSGTTAPVQLLPSLLLQQTPLPTFDGSYETWYKFRDRFTDVVNKCTGDSPATKLHFLDKALIGKAKGAIDQQTLNDNNYEGAWRILAKRFENLRMVVQAHIGQLLSLKSMVKGSHAELTSLLDVVEKRLESLEFHNLKMHDKLSEALIVNLVISKLDIDTRKAWEATVDSSSTKLRVVFDASAKTTTSLSLNDVLMEAPVVQSPLFDIVLRWRLPKYAFTGDAKQMYRQVVMHAAHTKYLRCLFRDDRTQPILDLELLRVTYGVGPAGFLATRSLVQLAKDEQNDFPDACEVVLKSFYVDDALTGADSLEKARKLREDLQVLLGRGGFKLHKWCANDPAILEGVPSEDREKQLRFEESDVNGVIKTLGLLWDPGSDNFVFRVKPMVECAAPQTKRQVLSEIARLFDPLGVLGPAIVLAKIVMQQLWRKKIDWDEPIPIEEFRVWNKLRSELCAINNMKIPRRVTVDNPSVFELHGFSDASQAAYGCCVYLRSVTVDGIVEVKLLCGKSRVAPLKELNRKEKKGAPPEELTTPRLELCAAVLLARQMKTVRETLSIDISRVVLRSDSSIVICWIRKSKPNQPVFIRNRIAEIRELTIDADWLHVGTKANPADLVSRGVLPLELTKSDLWWNGPEFLRSSVVDETVNEETEDLSEETISVTVVTVPDEGLYEVIQNSSNFRRLQRVFGYVTRFIRNCRAKRNESEFRRGRLNIADFRDSLYTMVKIVQNAVYRDEIRSVLKGEPVKGKLRNLNPVFDKTERLLRVGGRIRNAILPLDQKHPLILPEKNNFTDIVIEAIHREELHVGLNGLLAKIRQQFWPVNAKRTIKRVLGKCIKCFRLKPKDVQQFMGDLPIARVTAAQPFARTGVDYAGPFLLKQGRSKTPIKSYVSVFVCMTTKAIHFELVSSLSAEGFLGALHRFVGRRGNVSEMFTDNGTNFVGAERQLAELRELLKSQLLENKLEDFCQPRRISWSFNPPKAPHQGGLWEAGVKSMKSHLYKVMNESYFTYEEMTTLLIQIESILNSRPIIPQSDDPIDYEALSPGHFLVGRELTAIAEPFYDGLKENTLSRYQLIQKRKQSFWRRWSCEYITGLQKRSKWNKTPTLLREGLLVIMKDDNLPPQTWKLGRIIKTHPGNDGVVRVVTVRTNNGTYKRSTMQIVVLPIEDAERTSQTDKLSHPAPGGGC
ncbi:uncharacterized protein LOC135703477 [Ochlerotatus camptorhynchus]|uniref:uncharacterized protein LOC135703477 n=1 Tax=Ochlerotatus camptorhynchus TaxID=644619 RepID=UPI0031D5A6F5